MLQMSRSDSLRGGDCICDSAARNGIRRVLEISPTEVLFVVYLASLPLDVRRDIVYKKDAGAIEVDDITREQLLAEAALISYAIETCDADA